MIKAKSNKPTKQRKMNVLKKNSKKVKREYIILFFYDFYKLLYIQEILLIMYSKYII